MLTLVSLSVPLKNHIFQYAIKRVIDFKVKGQNWSRLCLSRLIVTDVWNLEYYATIFNIYETHCCTKESHLYL